LGEEKLANYNLFAENTFSLSLIIGSCKEEVEVVVVDWGTIVMGESMGTWQITTTTNPQGLFHLQGQL
jgi:hypothetical protein